MVNEQGDTKELYFDDGVSLEKIAESGQCFRWKKLEAGTYLVPANGWCAILVQKTENTVEITCNPRTIETWRNYLACYDDYSDTIREAEEAITQTGAVDEYLREAVKAAAGLRILCQDLWEAIVSFVISQNNNIPRIKSTIELLCERFGTEKEFCGHRYYTFPTPEQLCNEDLTTCGLGYRAEYLESIVKNTLAGTIDLRTLRKSDTGEARNILKSIRGIGDKVADCILLYGLNRLDAFPVDTWMKKIIAEHYGGKFPIEHYSEQAGLIQQYLFYYERKEKQKC